MDEDSITIGLGALVTFIIGIGIFLLWGLSLVQYNEYCVEREFGTLKEGIKDTGFEWVGFGTLQCVNNQVRNYEIKVEAASKDMQNVLLELNMNTKIIKEQTYNFNKNYLTEEAYQQYLNNKVQEKVKAVLVRYPAEEMIFKRLEISESIKEEVKEIKELQYFEFNDLTIKNIQFSEEFNNVLEKKAQVQYEGDIIRKQKENLVALKKNVEVMDIDTYFKYKLIEKWDGKSALIISESLLLPGIKN